MKKTILLLGFMSLFILITAMQCDEDDAPTFDCQQTLQSLLENKAGIESLAAESVCNDDFECRFIAFGSKPCGGPWEFLVYSTSIDTLALMTAVADYNQMEELYNINCNAVSDCSTPQPPMDFSCENNLCVPLF